MAVWQSARRVEGGGEGGGMVLHVLSSLFGKEIIEFYK